MSVIVVRQRYDSAILLARDPGRYTGEHSARWALVGFGGVAAALAVGSMAFACTAGATATSPVYFSVI